MREIVKFKFLVLVGLATLSTFVHAQVVDADYVFTNANVYTVNKDAPWAEAIAVKSNKIVYVGSSEGAQIFISDATEVHDLDGKMITPGFFSGHEHFVSSAWMGMGVALGEGQSKQDYLDLIKAYADANPNEKFIRGLGWNGSLMDSPPTAADLDKIVPDRPVILQDYTVHDMWLNSKAMEMGNVDKNTPDAIPGLTFWVRDDAGNPIGEAKEFAWMPAFIEMGAWQPETMISESQTKLYNLAASYGYTGYINQGLVTPNIKEFKEYFSDYRIALELLTELDNQNKLKMRTFFQVLYKNEKTDVDAFVADTIELRNEYNTDTVGITGIKIHPEGVFTSHASVMLEPWTDLPDSKAVRGVSAARSEEVVLKANKVGLDVSIHTDGSKTQRETIDTYIKAKELGYEDARNSLQHFANVHPDDFERVVKYNIPVNLTPIWATTWGGGLESAMKILGQKRVEKAFQPLGRAIRAGIPTSIGADVPSTDISLSGPLYLCQSAITRKDPSNPSDKRTFPPSTEAISLEQCLFTATMGGAYQARMEHKVGSLEVGKYADLVIFERNLFEVEPDNLVETKILATMMNGTFTYQQGLQ
ncbi:amidohydrolase [Vibrio ulleungensis]|uniref:Amidohydrolase family protein n=1 Tax=Vibrio ulleungensis TaxID=2807619 RepID=A0ABS2HI60_9VIBR|nr:amidohydrolase family protein [Vibrio ulleungensis]MBM7036776.1 amidohydrolase family protein [Vibrio ulleungensis]